MKTLFLVGAGGFIGSILRYLIAMLMLQVRAGFPLGTLLVNIIGSLFIGLLMGIFEKYTGIDALKNFLIIGVLGGFTTFSSFTWEALHLLQKGAYIQFLAYVLISVILGLIVCFLGYQAIVNF